MFSKLADVFLIFVIFIHILVRCKYVTFTFVKDLQRIYDIWQKCHKLEIIRRSTESADNLSEIISDFIHMWTNVLNTLLIM